ncbi:MAG: hypothetical protein ACRENK_08375 [Gemmatimonadaceae bacterium]
MSAIQGQEPPRVKKFRLEIAAAIPRIPNDRASLEHMRKKRLVDVLIDYISWRARYVGVRSRTVSVEPAARIDPQWSRHSRAINSFLDKVRRGDDLTPHLSIQPRTRGYALAAYAPDATSDERWSDKDFLLNTLDYHHFHLDAAGKTGGHGKGKDELIFAEVTRDRFHVVAIFGHKVFEPGTKERRRLTKLHHAIAARGAPPGAVVIGSTMLTTSAHTLHAVRYAQRCAQVVEDMDPKIDDDDEIKVWFAHANMPAPQKPTFEWIALHLDLGFLEKITKTTFWLLKGWN